LERRGTPARALAAKHGFGDFVDWDRPLILWRRVDPANRDALWQPYNPDTAPERKTREDARVSTVLAQGDLDSELSLGLLIGTNDPEFADGWLEGLRLSTGRYEFDRGQCLLRSRAELRDELHLCLALAYLFGFSIFI
jgi:hypothetical protein